MNLSKEQEKRVLSLAQSGLSYEAACAKVLGKEIISPEVLRSCNGKGFAKPLERPVHSLSTFEEKLLRSAVDIWMPEFSSYSKSERIVMIELYERLRRNLWEMRCGVDAGEKNSATKKDRHKVGFGDTRIQAKINRENGIG